MTSSLPTSIDRDDSTSDLVTNCWFLVGSTASGKTEVSLSLAEKIGAEIISLDSMAVYRGLDIGTAKPSREDQQRIPHHLLDLVEPTVEFNVTEYVNLAHEKVSDIRSRGREVLFTGGTPLYLKSLLRGLLSGPPADWEFRNQVEQELQQVGLDALHARLHQVDPLTAARLHRHDKRRIIRALEYYKITGQPISHQQTQFEEGRPAERCRVFVLAWPRPQLHERINSRVERMFADGLVAETRELLAHHGSLSRTAMQAVGYREIIAHLESTCDLPETIERCKARTRQFARRQETWFRSLSECRWINQQTGETPLQVAEHVCAAAEANQNH